MTAGYAWGFWALAIFGFVALAAAVTLIRREELAETPVTAPVA